jgi:hypothetical protein
MPVEIGQLVFRAKVDLEASGEAPTGKDQRAELRELVELCVEEVMEILRREKER